MFFSLLIYLSFSGWCQNKYKFNIKLDISVFNFHLSFTSFTYQVVTFILYYIIFRHSFIYWSLFSPDFPLSPPALTLLSPSAEALKERKATLVCLAEDIRGYRWSLEQSHWETTRQNLQNEQLSDHRVVWLDGWCRFLMWSVSGIKIH